MSMVYTVPEDYPSDDELDWLLEEFLANLGSVEAERSGFTKRENDHFSEASRKASYIIARLRGLGA